MTKKVYGRKETDPERLRLLEAVAEAMRDVLAAYGPEWEEWLDADEDKYLVEAMNKGRTGLEALAALEAYIAGIGGQYGEA